MLDIRDTMFNRGPIKRMKEINIKYYTDHAWKQLRVICSSGKLERHLFHHTSYKISAYRPSNKYSVMIFLEPKQIQVSIPVSQKNVGAEITLYLSFSFYILI